MNINKGVDLFNGKRFGLIRMGKVLRKSEHINVIGCDLNFQSSNLVTNPLKFQNFVYFKKYE